jgi:hypothetical protein
MQIKRPPERWSFLVELLIRIPQVIAQEFAQDFLRAEHLRYR